MLPSALAAPSVLKAVKSSLASGQFSNRKSSQPEFSRSALHVLRPKDEILSSVA
jgi:hypothetical protein